MSLCPTAEAKVVRIVMDEQKDGSEARRNVPADYRVLKGLAYGELDPHDPHNRIITDIDLAEKNSRGMLEYTATFTLYVPLHPAPKTVLLYDVVNRGGAAMPREYANGDYFLISGWQADIAFGGRAISGGPGETVKVPVARGVTGAAVARFYDLHQGKKTLALAQSATYISSGVPPVPADLDTGHAHLVTKQYEDSDGATSGVAEIPQSDWAWGDCERTSFPGKADATKICLKNGADASLLYELRYTAKDPQVLGVGFAAMRDVNTFFRYEKQDSEGTLNPVYGHVRSAISTGVSQSGNTLRSMVNLGFNEDEQGRRVWDGVMPIIAARQTPENVRFGVPGGTSMVYDVGTDGVNWWTHATDPVRGNPAEGLLDRCTAAKNCPKIVELLGSAEFYSLRASMAFVGTSATRDLPLPLNVRRYYVNSTTHGGGGGGFNLHQHEANNCVLETNPNPEGPTRRALLLALKQWVVDGTLPPASVYPTLAEGTLAPASKVMASFPHIPGEPMPVLNPNLIYALGPDFHANDLSGVVQTRPQPVIGVAKGVLPTLDADGNEIGGLHTALRDAPLGTYVGWNVVTSGFRKGQFCALTGGYIPFAATAEERKTKHDPRPSIEERYGTHAQYVERVRATAMKQARERLLLQDDAEKMIAEAEASTVLR
ncbi:alpha/beta hydrolase domain-containing protein [Terriglobus saanensis]|uniref:alpha/beta hydrolase domain-containing protein n=1 Tax=Terriglobus saanensis TaxID=870903 RepID=UPI001187109A|nr:alpha/beta hydrolase domain-containing protein [Terriglobus saanensis]